MIESGNLRRVEGTVTFSLNDLIKVTTTDGENLYPHRDRCPAGMREGDRVSLVFGTQDGYVVNLIEDLEDDLGELSGPSCDSSGEACESCQ